jgi:hypothetical protein
LNLVLRMDNSDGSYTTHGKYVVGSEIKCNMQDKKPELIQLFKSLSKYAWFFKEKDAIKKRFTPQKPKMSFDALMLMQAKEQDDLD